MLPPKKRRELSEAEFQRVFREVRADINDLQLHDKVFDGVVENLTRYPRLGSNFPAFFGAFYAGMRTDLIIRLGRIYDPERTGHESCTLGRCLSVLRENPQFFTDAAITARLSEAYRRANPNYLSFHGPDLRQIDIDLDRIGKSREKLINLRHKLYAHKDLETVLGKRHEFLSSHDEIKELIALAHEIWNRHSLIWDASTYSDKTIGEDDYKWLFSYLRHGMKTKSVIENRQFERLRKRIEVVKHGTNMPERDALQKAVLRSIELLARNDGVLFEMPIEKDAHYDARKLHEVCINHKLAEHLGTEILPLFANSREIFVDIEFNREGVDFKDVIIAGQIERVRPDIIIHNRRSHAEKFNFLVVECKKSDTLAGEITYDREKITALMTDPRYDYHFGLQVIYDACAIKGTLFYKQDSLIRTSAIQYRHAARN